MVGLLGMLLAVLKSTAFGHIALSRKKASSIHLMSLPGSFQKGGLRFTKKQKSARHFIEGLMYYLGARGLSTGAFFIIFLLIFIL